MRLLTPPGYDAVFESIIHSSHPMVTHVDVLYAGNVVESAIPVTEGTIRWGSEQASALLNCTISDPTRIPASIEDYLMPDGHELRVWRGAVIEGVSVMCALGTFPIQQSSFGARGRQSRVVAHDRSQFVKDAGFEDTYWIDATTPVDEALASLISDAFPSAEFNFASTTITTPLLTWDSGDRWQEARDVARSAGWILYLDGEGKFTTRQQATVDSEPVASLASGVNLIDASVTLDRAPTFNRVIARSRNASTGVEYEGIATLEGGRYGYDTSFGRKPKVIYSEKIGSQEAADAMAQSELTQVAGITASTDFQALPDVRLEIEDVVSAYVPQIGTDAPHIIDTLTMGLGPTVAMSGTTRVVLV